MHAHHHVHPHAELTHGELRARERRRLGWALAATTALLVGEAVGGWLSHSLALLSDAAHMLSDVVAQALALGALALASRPPDARRTYGWYRLEILAALVNGLVLVILAGGLLWSASQRLRAPVEIHTATMLAVAAMGLGANLLGAWLLHGSHTLTARSAYLHVLLDGLSSVGVLIAGTVMHLSGGTYWLDPLLSIAIAVFILYSAYRLVRDAVDVLLEAVPRGIDLAGVSEVIDAIEGVKAVHDLHIWTITSGLYALSAHLVVAPDSRSPRDALLVEVKAMLQRRFAIAHTTLQIETAEYDHSCHVC